VSITCKGPQDIARGAGLCADNGGFLATERVEQTRLARVRGTGDNDGVSIPQHPTLTGIDAKVRDARAQRIELPEQFGIGEKIDFFFGKIDRRLDMDAQRDDLLRQDLDLPGEVTLQGGHGRTRGSRRPAGDDVGDRFGLGKIEFPVEKGAFGEFAWTREAGAERQNAGEHQIQHHRAAMALQLQHVFAGKGIWRREIKRQAFVQRHAIITVEPRIVCVAWRWQLAQQDASKIRHSGAGNTDDTNAAESRRRGNGGNRLGKGGH